MDVILKRDCYDELVRLPQGAILQDVVEDDGEYVG